MKWCYMSGTRVILCMMEEEEVVPHIASHMERTAC
jgi:hypothetical protein